MSDKDLYITIQIAPEDIENKEYVCHENNCNKTFNNEQNLKKHINQHYVENGKSMKIIYQYCCPVISCRRFIAKDYFASRKHVIQHFFKVHNSEKYNCTNKDCDKSFSTEILRNLHLKNCGKTFECNFCKASYSSAEALLTHRRRKNHPLENNSNKKKKNDIQQSTKKSVSTGTSTISSQTSPAKVSVHTSPKAVSSESKSTITDDIFSNQPSTSSSTKFIKNSSTSTADDFMKEDNSNSLSSSSSQNKTTNVNWIVTNGQFEEDSVTLFGNDVKMEFYSAETQTDFSESLFNNNYTQTSFADFYDFEKFDSQTQTNWDEFNQGF